ncbi:hypothetical protein BBOR36S_00525 [Brevibacillus borstelensis]|jgi:hypothetical protein
MATIITVLLLLSGATLFGVLMSQQRLCKELKTMKK